MLSFKICYAILCSLLSWFSGICVFLCGEILLAVDTLEDRELAVLEGGLIWNELDGEKLTFNREKISTR
jgi:hypothetical protein